MVHELVTGELLKLPDGCAALFVDVAHGTAPRYLV